LLALAALIGFQRGNDVIGMLAAQPGNVVSGISVGVAGDGMTAGAGFELGFSGRRIAGRLRGTGEEAADGQGHTHA